MSFDSEDRYAWLGAVWRTRVVSALHPEADEAVSDDGRILPAGELFGALLRGEALLVEDPEGVLALRRAPTTPAPPPDPNPDSNAVSDPGLE